MKYETLDSQKKQAWMEATNEYAGPIAKFIAEFAFYDLENGSNKYQKSNDIEFVGGGTDMDGIKKGVLLPQEVLAYKEEGAMNKIVARYEGGTEIILHRSAMEDFLKTVS